MSRAANLTQSVVTISSFTILYFGLSLLFAEINNLILYSYYNTREAKSRKRAIDRTNQIVVRGPHPTQRLGKQTRKKYFINFFCFPIPILGCCAVSRGVLSASSSSSPARSQFARSGVGAPLPSFAGQLQGPAAHATAAPPSAWKEIGFQRPAALPAGEEDCSCNCNCNCKRTPSSIPFQR